MAVARAAQARELRSIIKKPTQGNTGLRKALYFQ